MFLLAFCALAVWVAHKAEHILGAKDPGCIVIDEIAGILIAGAGLPFNTPIAAIIFILFRLLDILKPFPWDGWTGTSKGGSGS